jgi:hypothetical protein
MMQLAFCMLVTCSVPLVSSETRASHHHASSASEEPVLGTVSRLQGCSKGNNGPDERSGVRVSKFLGSVELTARDLFEPEFVRLLKKNVRELFQGNLNSQAWQDLIATCWGIGVFDNLVIDFCAGEQRIERDGKLYVTKGAQFGLTGMSRKPVILGNKDFYQVKARPMPANDSLIQEPGAVPVVECNPELTISISKLNPDGSKLWTISYSFVSELRLRLPFGRDEKWHYSPWGRSLRAPAVSSGR